VHGSPESDDGEIAVMAIAERPVYMLMSRPAVPGSYEEAVERARALKPRLRERVAQTERLRHLAPENVGDVLENGLYGLMTPKRFGGSELGSEAMIDVTIELASACPSTGWVHMLWTAHMWLLALFPPDAQEEVWSNPNTLASSVVNTTGDVVPVDGGYRWSGRGFFSSGADHCNWLTAAVPIKRPDMPEGAQPERRWMLIPREDFEIIDDWYTVGLKGAGSKTIVINDGGGACCVSTSEVNDVMPSAVPIANVSSTPACRAAGSARSRISAAATR